MKSKGFNPKFKISNRITAGLTRIERARGFLEAARLSEDWLQEMSNRTAFYLAIQGVRESNMDMTGWLEYFVQGLSTQLAEVRQRGEQVIRRDVLIQKHKLSDRG